MQLVQSEASQLSPNRPIILRTLGPAYFYFLVAGTVTVMLGPLLPQLIQHWQIQDAQAGTLFTADFIGQLCGAWIAARNLRASLIYGSILSAAGCIALTWLGFGAAHIALFCIGVGLGTGLTAGNIIAGTTLPAIRAKLLAVLNVAWGLGAIACPLLIYVTAAGGMRRFLFVIATLLVSASLYSIALPRAGTSFVSSAASELSGSEYAMTDPRFPLPLLPLISFAAAMFLYVGVENSLGGWLPSYAIRSSSSLQASSIATYFWIAELIGRLLVAALMTVLSERALYRLCLLLLLITEGLFCSIAHPSGSGVIALTILGGFTLAPVFPLLVSFMLARTGNHKRLGVLFASASVGGAVLPWLTGVCSTYFHGLRVGLVVPAAGSALLLLLSGIVTAKANTPFETNS
ncbi:MFS transporter [Tunturiibacter gelidoferens]|uniref:Fucose permease n=2 Tax=Tunturiibacter TaxID=3154218 RepID=A0A7Y9NM74_9BACT|nr:MFS transporter [Edaphobacter lichenicola]MBB5338918.1 fucose permease [Edaphobacter lichenicola]NYF51832.1 fucose permease [Edaphobacter lichenicola]